MVTKLTRAVVREVAEIDTRTRKPLVIRLEEGGKLIRIRAKGDRMWYTASIRQLFNLGAQNRANEIKSEREKRRAERKQLTKKSERKR